MNINKKIIMINAVIKKSFFDIIITPLLEDSVTPNKLNISCINYNIVDKLNQYENEQIFVYSCDLIYLRIHCRRLH